MCFCQNIKRECKYTAVSGAQISYLHYRKYVKEVGGLGVWKIKCITHDFETPWLFNKFIMEIKQFNQI